MNRRNMLKSLATILGASCAPGLFIPKFEPVRWKIIKPIWHFQYGDTAMNPPEYCGRWQYITDWIEAVKPEYPELIEVAFLPRAA